MKGCIPRVIKHVLFITLLLFDFKTLGNLWVAADGASRAEQSGDSRTPFDSFDVSHTVVLDAGSTGTRVYVYNFTRGATYLSELKLVEVGHRRVNPALATFVGNKPGLRQQLDRLLDYAKGIVPVNLWSTTSVALKATAGLRSLPDTEQTWLMSAVREVLQTSGFRFNSAHTAVISGEEESLFDFLAIVSAFGTLYGKNITYGAADLGGSSKQIAFPSRPRGGFNSSRSFYNGSSSTNSKLIGDREIAREDEISCGLPDWTLGARYGEGSPTHIYARSVGGLGLVDAMEGLLKSHIDLHHRANSSDEVDCPEEQLERGQELCEQDPSEGRCGWDGIQTEGGASIPRNLSVPTYPANPCIPPGAFPFIHDGEEKILTGSGDFDACRSLIRATLIPKAAREAACLRYAGRPDVIVGMDNFPKVLEVLRLSGNGAVSPNEIEAMGRILCPRKWQDVLEEFPGFMPYRAQRACFGAAYIYSIITDVYGIAPDDGKTFLPIEAHGHIGELSWSIGAAVAHALENIGDSFPYKYYE